MESTLDQNSSNNQQLEIALRSKMRSAGGHAKAMGIVFLGISFIAFLFVLLFIYASTQSRWGGEEFLVAAFFSFIGLAVFFLIGFFALRFGTKIRKQATSNNEELIKAFGSLSASMLTQTILFGLGFLFSLILVVVFLEEVSRMGRYYY